MTRRESKILNATHYLNRKAPTFSAANWMQLRKCSETFLSEILLSANDILLEWIEWLLRLDSSWIRNWFRSSSSSLKSSGATFSTTWKNVRSSKKLEVHHQENEKFEVRISYKIIRMFQFDKTDVKFTFYGSWKL